MGDTSLAGSASVTLGSVSWHREAEQRPESTGVCLGRDPRRGSPVGMSWTHSNTNGILLLSSRKSPSLVYFPWKAEASLDPACYLLPASMGSRRVDDKMGGHHP